MELDFWGSTDCRGAEFDAAKGRWNVVVDRPDGTLVLHPVQLGRATGLSGAPRMPGFPGQETFEGVQYHSAHHQDASALAGKNVVVVGGNNSAHDICVDLWAADAKVTMIQRSPTSVVK